MKTRYSFLVDLILNYLRDHEEIPGQIDVHPFFLTQLEKEIQEKNLGMDAIGFGHRPIIQEPGPLSMVKKFFGIPLYVTDQTHSARLHSKGSVEY